MNWLKIAVPVVLVVVLIIFVVNFQNITGNVTRCVIDGVMPDAKCTPGAVFNATKEDICTPGYSSSVRDVSYELKQQVYAMYGIAHHDPYEYEIDHFIPLELGGSNDISNLWPEAAEPRPGYHEKDKIENYLHRQVCIGNITLQEAQERIKDWLPIYNDLYGPVLP